MENKKKAIYAEDLLRTIRDNPYISGRAFARVKQHIDEAPPVDAAEVVRCSYCDPNSKEYNPCWLCEKGGTAHDVEHCHSTNYGDYEPVQAHCHLCGRKL